MNIPRANELKISGINGAMYYGGNQEWYSSNTWAMGGCGSVAGANVLRCLARCNKNVRNIIRDSSKLPSEVKSALCSDLPTREHFSLLMTSIYKSMWAIELFPLNRIYDRYTRGTRFFSFIKPNFGLTNTGFIIGIIRFASRIGLDIEVQSLPTAFCDSQKGLDFIREGLSQSGAVVLLTSYNKHNLQLYPSNSSLEAPLNETCTATSSSMKCHFATITDVDTNTNRLLITTWGRPATVDYSELAQSWKSIKGFESTLMYITPSTRSESKASMLRSWRPYVYGILQSLLRRFLY